MLEGKSKEVMKAGVIGIPDRDFDPIESFTQSKEAGDGTTLNACLEVRSTADLGQYVLQSGRAAIQELGSEERVRINPEHARVTVTDDESIVRTRYTEFITVPGEFVVVSSGDGAFAFRLISGSTTSATIKRGNIDLEGFEQSYQKEEGPEKADIWKIGFYGHGGTAENGTLYGDSVISDPDFGNLVRSLPKNQIGLLVQQGKEEIKLTATESGYVEIYQPSNYDSKEFSQFALDHILEHTERQE